jgi:hypothetical protein
LSRRRRGSRSRRFRGKRGTIDGSFSTIIALSKRKEHNLATYALFVDLVKAFDTVNRTAQPLRPWTGQLTSHSSTRAKPEK